MEGWIKISRKLMDNTLWTSEPFTRGQAWVDLILLASIKDSFFYVRGVKINIKRGQVAWSETKISSRWNWSRTKLRKFLKDLEKEQQIIQHKSNVLQIITIVNYNEYQQKEPQIIQQKDNRKTTERQQKNTLKEGKEDKEYKEYKERGTNPKFVPPSSNEVKTYCEERKNKVNHETFIDFYTAKGWKIGKETMKDWKAAVRTWEKRQKTDSKWQPPVQNFKF